MTDIEKLRDIAALLTKAANALLLEAAHHLHTARNGVYNLLAEAERKLARQ